VEAFVQGEYKKHNNNTGFIGNNNMASDKQNDAGAAIRATPQAFSHFTYEHTGGALMIVDIQGWSPPRLVL
jgi:hypothetical protein